MTGSFTMLSASISATGGGTGVPIEYLIVAGGGGGGGGGINTFVGAGGGAGGFLEGTTLIAFDTSHPVSVGSGGIPGGSGDDTGGNGSPSSFNDIVAVGGGGGACSQGSPLNGLPGGSGGGGRFTTATGGVGVAYQGYAGGSCLVNGAGAGGGGAGGAGGNASVRNRGGNGGAGKISNITGTDVYYAGGGAGGGVDTNGQPGLSSGTNKGSGGAGRNSSNSGTAGPGTGGGDGIVILRYKNLIRSVPVVTGSPAITTITGYKVYTWIQSGSINFTEANITSTFEYLIIGFGKYMSVAFDNFSLLSMPS